MGYGPTSVSSLATSDNVAPGAPTFLVIVQEDNDSIQCTVNLPAVDSNGEPLSGLRVLTVATIASDPTGTNPFEGLSMDQILALPTVRSVNEDLEPTDAGGTAEVELPIVNLGGTQWIVAACAD